MVIKQSPCVGRRRVIIPGESSEIKRRDGPNLEQIPTSKRKVCVDAQGCRKWGMHESCGVQGGCGDDNLGHVWA